MRFRKDVYVLPVMVDCDGLAGLFDRLIVMAWRGIFGRLIVMAWRGIFGRLIVMAARLMWPLWLFTLDAEM